MSKFTVVKSFVKNRYFNSYTSKDRIHSEQLSGLQNIRDFLVKSSPYFKNLPPIKTIKDLKTWPIMDKRIMMEHFDEMSPLKIKSKEALQTALNNEKKRSFHTQYKGLSIGLSSGTSGHRGLFIVSDHEREVWAGKVLAQYLPQGKLLGHKVAFFLRADNNLYQTVASKVLQFKYFDIYQDMGALLNELAEYKPTILVAPPSVLLIIAKEAQKESIDLRLQLVISVAEVITSADSAFIKKCLKQDVIHQIYQCTEGFLAHTCMYGTLHLNEDCIYFEREYIDKKRFVPIITDFKRTTQPIIRYRLNDILVSGHACRCGSALGTIKRIEGREADILVFKNKRNYSVRVFSDMILRCMIYASGYNEYRVVQTSYYHLDIYLDTMSRESRQNVKNEIKKLSVQIGFVMPTLSFKKYEVDLTKKLRRVERTFAA